MAPSAWLAYFAARSPIDGHAEPFENFLARRAAVDRRIDAEDDAIIAANRDKKPAASIAFVLSSSAPDASALRATDENAFSILGTSALDSRVWVSGEILSAMPGLVDDVE
jgi:hypothetical protein